jgi:hypothetical protein
MLAKLAKVLDRGARRGEFFPRVEADSGLEWGSIILMCSQKNGSSRCW